MNIRQIVGDNIRHIREKRGWIQEDLASITGMGRSYLGQVERGQRAATVDTLAKIAKALKIEIAVLVTRDAYKDID